MATQNHAFGPVQTRGLQDTVADLNIAVINKCVKMS